MGLSFKVRKEGKTFVLSYKQAKIFGVLKKLGPKQRRQLVDILDWPRTTVYDNLDKLEQHNLVERYPNHDEIDGPGRPPMYWKIK